VPRGAYKGAYRKENKNKTKWKTFFGSFLFIPFFYTLTANIGSCSCILTAEVRKALSFCYRRREVEGWELVGIMGIV
jgi:hypothetical protein